MIRFVLSRYRSSHCIHVTILTLTLTTLLIQLQIYTANMANSSKASNGRPDRTLRIITIVAFIPALALLIPSGVVTAKPLPAIGLVPMAMSLVVSMAALSSKKSAVNIRPTADAIVASSLMIVMVFRLVPSPC